MAAAHRQATLAGPGVQLGGVGEFNIELGSPGLGGMPGGLNMAQLAQLNAAGDEPIQHEHARHG